MSRGRDALRTSLMLPLAMAIVSAALASPAPAGRPQHLRVVVENIEINPPLSDALFEMSALATP